MSANSSMADEEIFDRLKKVLEETFEIEPRNVSLQSNLFTDLDLDSIDAVDLTIKLQEMTGKRIRPEEFKTVRTVADIVAAVRGMMATS